jgi:inner membrane transporter RhtA
MAIDRTTRGALLTLLAATLWGVSGAIAGGVFEVVSRARVTQSRALIALVVLVPYAAHRGVLRLEGGFWKFAPISVGRSRDLLIIGVFGTAVPFIVGFAALRLASSGVVGVVATAEPAIAAIAATVLLGQTLAPIQWVGVWVVVIAIATVQRIGLTEVHPTSSIA